MEKRPYITLGDYEEIDSDDDPSSGAESFCSDDEAYYRQDKDPVEDSPDGPSGSRNGSGPSQPHPAQWKTADDPDTAPDPFEFVPRREPGHQLNSFVHHSPLDLFSLFVDRSTMTNLCSNINKQAAKNIANGKQYTWTTLQETEFYRFLGLTFLFCLVKARDLKESWNDHHPIFSHHSPHKVMSWDRYRTITYNIHMSDPDQDVENDKKRGTPQHDQLFRLRPLVDTLSAACKTHFHPRQNISISERTAISTNTSGTLRRYEMQNPRKWAFKLFVLVDSSNGYVVDFVIYTGKSELPPGVGMSYDSVMSLIKPSFLGSGYNLYVSDFHTSPKLFMDLYAMKIGACGVYWKNRKDFPQTRANALQKNHPRGTLRWIRDGPLVCVMWKDSKPVPFCSTIHPAFTGETIMQRVRGDDGRSVNQPVPCPKPVTEYNKHMKEDDDLLEHFPDQLFQYYKDRNREMRFYRALFYHFLDIAATNAYLLHKELLDQRGLRPMSHWEFLLKLIHQLCEVTV